MKYILNALLIIVVGVLGTGYYFKNSGDVNGEIVIGIGVLLVAFVLMPLFIYLDIKIKI